MIPIEANLVYGMVSGLALLMDAYRPERPNGRGVLLLAGCGWQAPLGYDAAQLKQAGQVQQYGEALLRAGYTMFAANHRAAPRFRYPDPVEDARRAVRYIRSRAADFGIDPQRIGASGGSSGGHLALLLGVLPPGGDPEARDPVERLSGRVQAVAAREPFSDFLGVPPGPDEGAEFITNFLGAMLRPGAVPGSAEYRLYAQASPVTHAAPGAAPTLLLHGDADRTAPFAHSERMRDSLQAAGVPVKLVRIPGGGHGPDFPGAADPPDYLGEMVAWFDRYLLG